MNIRFFCLIGLYILVSAHSLQSATVIEIPMQLAPLPLPRTFAEWCKQKQRFIPETLDTIDSILTKIGTKDCDLAQVQLRSISALRITDLRPYISKLKPTREPLSYLSVDIPMAIDLRPIVAAMPNLHQLDLSNTLIASFAPIRSLNHLEDLNLSNTQLKDLTPLANLTNLVHLNLSHNQIRELGSISKLKQLEYLNVSDNKIKDFSVLVKLKKLFGIKLNNNPIDPETCLGKWTSSCEGGE